MGIDAAGNFNDGAMRFGSQVLNILDSAGAATDYIAEAFSIDQSAEWIVSKDENGRPNKQHATPEVKTGSATLQLEGAATKSPKLFAEFTATDVSGNTVDLVVGQVGEAFQQDGETKVTIQLREVLN